VRPVIEPAGEARPNAEVFSELASRLGVGEAEEETDTLLRITGRFPNGLGSELMEHGIIKPPYDGAPVQFVDVFPRTPDQKIDLYPAELVEHTHDRLYVYQPDPETEQYPLALISPASEKTVSSTLGELRERAATLQMHPRDASARHLAPGDPVRVFNDLGEVQCPVALNAEIKPGTVSLPKGLWRRNTYNGATANALAPDSLTDLGDGACFNDARVQVVLLGRH
jgi:anaerobic selenocysteine-containing dehydrogenase